MPEPDEFVKLSKMNFDVSEEQSLILEQVDRACKEFRPIEDKYYLGHRVNDQVRPFFARAHLLGLPVSRRYGDGQGADMVTYALAIERIGREGTGVRTFFSVHMALGEMTVQHWGTEEQKARILTPATKGDAILAFGLTEPNAGSDPASLTTSFEERGGRYLISGQKMWISLGSSSKYVLVFAYPKGKRNGMNAFVVDTASSGFKAELIPHKLGLPTADTSTLYLDKVEVSKEDVLGPPGKGMSVALSGLMNGRLSVAAGCVGVMQDCLDEAVKYAGVRFQHGKVIGKHQLVQRHIGLIATNLEAARLLLLKAAFVKQKYEENPRNVELRDATDLACARAKYFAANASFDAANRAVQIFGGNGYSLENRPARHFADTRVTMIYEGANEIMEQKLALGALGKGFEAYS
ncbi:MAG: acyl-CoA/acyl-ACP dehydrogenase [Nitrososphaerota archaeon]|jgi:alkylation response protein AidB-like acyl-CoA dehydrogenase|nr:acyl-CoA/acyl-ACP dehydrogenase [Nitrososphaerota archaeon]MDG6946462.1 acyl-CoA/acyl-ACP dehydrogenase [Nitrososphaerota archaeon]MDG6947786.1 acyl-CoA/acyl-ACP dehydrogenase [Nitrososphaerota archaeon]